MDQLSLGILWTMKNLYICTESILSIVKQKEKSRQGYLNFINRKCANGYTALHYAAFRGNLEIIKILIENGADHTAKNTRGLNILHIAAQGDQPEVLIYFKEKYGMDINETDNNGSTPLHWACFMSSEVCVDFLLSWIDKVNVKESMGYTPLHLAIFSGSI